jgi:glycosyltransferase involved in cell wall biosynthesis
VPVITGRASALAEVAGGAVEHVDRLDADALGDAMVALARSRERREHLAAAGIARAREFSWTRAARETLEIYRHAARQAAATPSHAAVSETHQPWVR